MRQWRRSLFHTRSIDTSIPMRRAVAIIAFTTLAAGMQPASGQRNLTCTITIQAEWTLPEGMIGSIGLKSATTEGASHIRVERGAWMLLDDHSYARVVRFQSDGRWEDRVKRCLECRDQVFRGQGRWRMREEVQPGCGYRRQYAFYLFVRDARTTKLVGEKQIIFPGRERMAREGLQLIDLGDLSRFF